MTTFRSKLFIDLEVKAPFKGALDSLALHNYAHHQNTRILLDSWAIDDGPIGLVDRAHGELYPRELRDAIADPHVRVVAHGAQFDRVVLRAKGISIPTERWYCTSARAKIHGLPGDLDSLSTIFKLGAEGKQAARGKELIDLFCDQGANPDDFPLEWMEFCDYSMHDISAMRALYHKMPAWCFTDYELSLYHLDQHINDRGFAVDLSLAQKMIDTSEETRRELDARVQLLSDGKIKKATQRDAVKNFVNEGGDAQLPNMRAETLRKALRDEQLTDDQREMIELRLLTARSSVAKCRTALATAGLDSRIRYTTNYAGGGRIGRFSHKGFQPGNMPRPSPAFEEQEMIDAALKAIDLGLAFSIWGEEANSVCADSIRGLIVAGPGKKLVQADYSSIEPRILAWYAQELWKLQAFRDKDADIGEDIYKIVFHRMTGIPFEEIDKFLRQQGKGADLSMGYEGGVAAFLNIANSYQMDLVKVAKSAPSVLPEDFILRGENEWEWAAETDNTLGLPREMYVALSALKHAWRDANPAIVGLWRGLLDCAKTAVLSPGKLFAMAHGKIHMKAIEGWLAIQLPSGRKIMLAKPKLEPEMRRNAKGEEYIVHKLTAMKAPGWFREPVYGGLLANLITQGLGRDILADGMLEADADGFPIIMDIHDEIIAEIDEHDPRDHNHLIESMLRRAAVKYPDLPLTAGGYTAKRYRKG